MKKVIEYIKNLFKKKEEKIEKTKREKDFEEGLQNIIDY